MPGPTDRERDRYVCEMIGRGYTYASIGAALGISRERVRQIGARYGVRSLSRVLPKRLREPEWTHCKLCSEKYQIGKYQAHLREHPHIFEDDGRNGEIHAFYLQNGVKTTMERYNLSSASLYNMFHRTGRPTRNVYGRIYTARDAEIFERYTAGATVKDLAAAYRLSLSHIRLLVRTARRQAR